MRVDWSARTHGARGSCVYRLHRPYTHSRTYTHIHIRVYVVAGNVTRIGIPIPSICVCVRVCAGILDREHPLMPPRPPANRTSSNARNGISEVLPPRFSLNLAWPFVGTRFFSFYEYDILFGDIFSATHYPILTCFAFKAQTDIILVKRWLIGLSQV